MPNLRCLPISRLDADTLLPLMREEENAWMSDLSWDYSAIRQILTSFVRQKLLLGYAAVEDKAAVGYTYFMIGQAKGTIGALYVANVDQSQKAIEQLVSLTITFLRDSPAIERIEAQIMPFNNLNLTASFVQHGFSHFARDFLELDLHGHHKEADLPSTLKLIPWSSTHLERAAEMAQLSYRDQVDAEICEDYRTKSGCESYLRSLVENPGCGVFIPDSSFMAVDGYGHPCGFLICSRISSGAAMIPQIAVHPSYQAKGIGNALVSRCFERLQYMGFRSVSLTVTEKNRRAFDWYQRLGFKIRKEFGAYVWQR